MRLAGIDVDAPPEVVLPILAVGLYLLADRPVRTGDYIKLHDGEEGYVEAIGWRSSRLRTQKNNTVIVPNQKPRGDRARRSGTDCARPPR